MNPNQEIESLDNAANEIDTENSMSVDDFIRELEAKEKDLHITAETTIIELAEGYYEGSVPDFIRDEFPEAAAKTNKPAANLKSRSELTKIESENKDLKEKLAKLEDDKTELTKDIKRHAQDLANFRSRIERERRESFLNQVTNLATQMLPVLDNLNRAIDFALSHEYTKDEEFRPFFDGVFLVNQQLNEVLGEMGISPIVTTGQQFDPHLHEAAATEETDEFEPNAICEELLKGYRIGDRVIRHSVVRVARPVPGTGLAAPEELLECEREEDETASNPEDDAGQPAESLAEPPEHSSE